MGEAFLLRKGGGGKQAFNPTITFVSEAGTSVTFTITNNDDTAAVINYEANDITPDAFSIELEAGATSDNLTITDLNRGVESKIYATATVVGKVLSNTSELVLPPFTYTEATGGTTATYELNGKIYKSHTFTSNGDFVVTQVGDSAADLDKIEYLIIAGGGSGGTGNSPYKNGGGGAGGYRSSVVGEFSGRNSTALSRVAVTTQSYPIVIGAGGVGNSTAGSDSSAFGITSTGGAGAHTGVNGGCGGGGRDYGIGRSYGLAGQGFDSGTNTGGGAGQSGSSAGGNGIQSTISDGTLTYRAGGGGAGGVVASAGGLGGGGNGSPNSSGQHGTANTGGGGGGAYAAVLGNVGGSGGSGVVIVRYEIPSL